MPKRISPIWIAVALALLAAGMAAGQTAKTGRAPAVVTVRPAAATTRPRPYSLTEQQVRELRDFLQAKRPERYEQLMELKSSDPRAYKRRLYALHLFMRRVKALPPHVQGPYMDMTDLSVKIWQQTREIKQTSGAAEMKALTKELRVMVAKRFEAEQIWREYHIEQLAQRVGQLRQQLKDRAARREQVIDETVQRYLKLATRISPRRSGPPKKPAPTTQPTKGPTSRPAEASAKKK